MALQAGMVFLRHRVGGIAREAHRDRALAAASFHVAFARTVASFATAGFVGSMGMGEHFAHHSVLEATVLIFVARYADVAAHVVAIRLPWGCRLSFFLGSRRIGAHEERPG